jgi:hypothetical protein
MEWFDASSEEYSDYDSWRLLNVPLMSFSGILTVLFITCLGGPYWGAP